MRRALPGPRGATSAPTAQAPRPCPTQRRLPRFPAQPPSTLPPRPPPPLPRLWRRPLRQRGPTATPQPWRQRQRPQPRRRPRPVGTPTSLGSRTWPARRRLPRSAPGTVQWMWWACPGPWAFPPPSREVPLDCRGRRPPKVALLPPRASSTAAATAAVAAARPATLGVPAPPAAPNGTLHSPPRSRAPCPRSKTTQLPRTAEGSRGSGRVPHDPYPPFRHALTNSACYIRPLLAQWRPRHIRSSGQR